jgi:class 3 adenylate cyclase
MDVTMPKKNGFEVCEILRKNYRTQFIPVVLITGLTKKEDRIAGIEAGADDFLNKPIDKRELIVRTRSLLRIKSLHDEIEQRNTLLNNILKRYVADEVYSQILKDPDKHLKLGGEKRKATILFADIRGFSSFSEEHNPEEIVDFLNKTFSELIKVIFKYNGIFDKYLGDGIMAYYDTQDDNQESMLNVLYTAKDMQKVFSELLNSWAGEDFSSMGMGIGINTGNVFVGNIGSERIMEHTVIGDAVNITQRLQAMAASNQILISDSTYQIVKSKVKVNDMPLMQLKGRQKEVAAYELVEILQ